MAVFDAVHSCLVLKKKAKAHYKYWTVKDMETFFSILEHFIAKSAGKVPEAQMDSYFRNSWRFIRYIQRRIKVYAFPEDKDEIENEKSILEKLIEQCFHIVEVLDDNYLDMGIMGDPQYPHFDKVIESCYDLSDNIQDALQR